MLELMDGDSDVHNALAPVRQLLNEALRRARVETRLVQNPRMLALLQSTAAAIDDLKMAFIMFEASNEAALRRKAS